MRVPTWWVATGAAGALAGATWLSRPTPPAAVPLVLAVPASAAPAPRPTSAASVEPSAEAPVQPAARPTSSAIPVVASGGWADVIASLDEARLAGYAAPAAADPTRWLDESCACLSPERERLAALAASGRAVVPGGIPILLRVHVVTASADRVELEVTDELGGYDVVGAASAAVRHPGRPARSWRGVLLRRDGRWRWSRLVEGTPAAPARVDRRAVG